MNTADYLIPGIVALAAVAVWAVMFWRAARTDFDHAIAELEAEEIKLTPQQKERVDRRANQNKEWRRRSLEAEQAGNEVAAIYWSRREAREPKKLPTEMLSNCNVLRTYEAVKNTKAEKKKTGMHYGYRVPANLRAVTSRKQMQRIVNNLLLPMGRDNTPASVKPSDFLGMKPANDNIRPLSIGDMMRSRGLLSA